MKYPLQMVPLILVLLSFTAYAQPVEPGTKRADSTDDEVGLSMSTEFSSSGASSWHPSAPSAVEVGTVQQSYTLSQALLSGPETTLTLALDYHRTDFEFEGTGLRPLLPERLVGAKIGAVYTRQLNPTWSYGALMEVGSYTAGEKGRWSSGGGSATFGAIGQYRFSPALSVKLGAVYQTLAGADERVTPAIGFAWQINPACRLTVGFPRTALSYQLTEHLRLGLVARGNVDTYRVKSEPDESGLSGVSLRDQKLSYTEIDASLEIEYICTPRLTLRASLGAVLQRTAEYHARAIKLETRQSQPIGSFGLEFTL